MFNSITFFPFRISFASLHLHVLDFLKGVTVYSDSRVDGVGQWMNFVQRVWILK